jgi:hypothetical protein
MQLYGANEVLVICTPDAKDNYKLLCDDHPEVAKSVRLVEIQNGQTEEELWDLFQRLTTQVAPDDEVIFDITNGFRSSPVLLLTALRFLQKVRGIRVVRVVYGAFDQRINNTTQIIDMQPFLVLQDWVDAAHAFLRYGNGEELAVLAAGLEKGASKNQKTAWERVARSIRRITVALQLVHLRELDEQISTFEELVAALELPKTNKYAPLHIIFTSIVSEFREFSAGAFPRDELIRQQKIMHWYTQHNMYAQAVILAKEWLDCYALYIVHPHKDDTALLQDFSDDTKKGKLPFSVFAKINLPITKTQQTILRDLRKSTAHASLLESSNGQYDPIQLIRDCTERIIAQKIPS